MCCFLKASRCGIMRPMTAFSSSGHGGKPHHETTAQDDDAWCLFHVFSFRERDRISLYTGQFLLTKELFIPKNCLFLSVDFPKDDTPDRTGARIPKGNHLQATEGLRRWCMSGRQPGRTKLDPDVHGFDVGGHGCQGPALPRKRLSVLAVSCASRSFSRTVWSDMCHVAPEFRPRIENQPCPAIPPYRDQPLTVSHLRDTTAPATSSLISGTRLTTDEFGAWIRKTAAEGATVRLFT